MNVKTVLLIDNANLEEVYTFDTVKEAQDFVAENGGFNLACIYTLYTTGIPISRYDWELQSDTGTNLREVKKTEPKPLRSGKWTEREVEVMIAAHAEGMTWRMIAGKLHRSRGAVYQKAVKIGLVGSEDEG